METFKNKTMEFKSRYSYLVFGLCPLFSAAFPNLIWPQSSCAHTKKKVCRTFNTILILCMKLRKWAKISKDCYKWMLNDRDLRSAFILLHVTINVSCVYVTHEPRKNDAWSRLNILHVQNMSIVIILALKKLELFEWMNALLSYKYENEFYNSSIWIFTFLIM